MFFATNEFVFFFVITIILSSSEQKCVFRGSDRNAPEFSIFITTKLTSSSYFLSCPSQLRIYKWWKNRIGSERRWSPSHDDHAKINKNLNIVEENNASSHSWMNGHWYFFMMRRKPRKRSSALYKQRTSSSADACFSLSLTPSFSMFFHRYLSFFFMFWAFHERRENSIEINV